MDNKKIISILIVMLFCLTIVNAFEFDNIKGDLNKQGSKYGKVEIRNSILGIPFLQLDMVEEVELLENSDVCGSSCYAEKEFVVYEDGSLIDDIRFKVYDKYGYWEYGEIDNYNLQIKTGETEKEIIDYRNVCSNKIAKNGSTIPDCSLVEDGSHIEIQEEWKDYNYESVKGSGEGISYKIRLEGTKKSDQKVDWIIKTKGIWIDDWAIWDSALSYYWKANENSGTTTSDEVGSLQYSGNMSWNATGRYGSSLQFNGDSEGRYINVTNQTLSSVFGENNWSLEFWIYPNNVADTQAVMSSGEGLGSVGKGGWSIGFVGNALVVFADNDTDTYARIDQLGAIYTNVWQHIAYTKNGSALTLYINGSYTNSTEIYVGLNGSFSHYIGNANGLGATNYFSGQLDEIKIWNTYRTEAEVLVDMDETTPEVFTITQNLPADNYNSSSEDIIFNCTAEGSETGILNLTLVIDGVNNLTAFNTTDLQNLSIYDTVSVAEGNHNWTCKASDVSQEVTNSNRSFIVDTTSPTIDVWANITNITTTTLPVSSYWNYTVADSNLGSCWYATSDDATNLSLACNVAIVETNWTTAGDKTIFYCVNDTFGFETCRDDDLIIVYINYTQADSVDPVGEGELVNYTFQINLTGITMPTTYAYLVANNTIFTPTSNAFTDHYDFEYVLTVPDGWGSGTGNNIGWYWNYTIEGFTSNASTDELNTTVLGVGMDDCSTYGTLILNMSLKDEEGNSYINATEGANVEVDIVLTKGAVTWTYSNQWTNNETGSEDLDAIVCVPDGLLNNSEYTIDIVIGFDSTDHVSEFYYLDQGTLSNSSDFDSLTNKSIDLMDLLTVDSTSFLFNYFDVDGLIVDNIIVHTFRNYIGEGVYREVERSKQNNDGDTVVHLVEEDVLYYFVISQNGTILFTSNTYTALCQTTPCEIQLEESGGFQEFDEDWDLVNNGGYSIISDSSARTVNLTYSLTTVSTMNLTVYKLVNDGSYEVVGTEEATGTSGTLTVDVPSVSGNTTFFASVYQDDIFLKSAWIDFEEDAGYYFGNTLALFLGALIILTLGLVAVSEGTGTVVFTLIGVVITMALGLVDYRTSASASVLIYLVVVGALIIWKLTRRNR